MAGKNTWAMEMGTLHCLVVLSNAKDLTRLETYYNVTNL